MRLIKFIVGAVIVLIGAYVLIGERMVGTSTDATLNARIVVIRAPIDGDVLLAVRTVGAKIANGDTVAEIVDRRFDTARLLDLERTQGLQQIELQRVASQLDALVTARGTLQKQSESYQTGRVRQIEARLGEAQAIHDAAQAKIREADSALKRTTDLAGRGVQTAITLDRAKANYDIAQQEIEGANQRLDYLRTELAAARQGVFLGDSYNDTPFSLQRIREIDLRVAELEGERTQIKDRLILVERQINAERLRLNDLASAVLTATSNGIIWDILSNNGEYVRRGQELVRIVDCSSVRVTASVSEAIYNSLRVGTEAQLRLFGDDRVFKGVITRLGGAGAAVLYTNLAVAPSAAHLRRFDVMLAVPELASQPDLECAVGRTGRVVFSSGPLGTLSQMLTRFGL
jgi:multidrug resistance efflux pump